MSNITAKTNSGGNDAALILVVLGLLGLGLIMVYSASSALAAKTYGSDVFFLKKQACFAMIGLAALILFRFVPYKVYKLGAYPILFLAIGLLVVLLASGLGIKANGAVRWLPAGPVNFQPSELAKIAIIIYLAYSMAKKGDKMRDFSVGIIPHIIVATLVACLMLAQPDFGTAALMIGVVGLMLFAGGARIVHLMVLGASAVPFLCLLVFGASYRLNRIMTFLNPWENQTGDGYQITHSLMAFGSGGFSGVGIGNGFQKLFYLPEPHTDFVFSVIGEELGLWGVGIVITLYSLLVWRGLAVANRTEDDFGKYLAFGITAAIGLQAFVNMAVTMGLLPTKGLALPFISYGGSSLLFNMNRRELPP